MMQCCASCLGLLCVLSAASCVLATSNNELASWRQVRQAPLEVCPKGSIGPVDGSTCVSCFCNGFSDACLPDTGWFQAQLQYSPNGDIVNGSRFRTNGIKEFTTEYLSVRPRPSSTSVYLSFPTEFLGDKRTAYSQSLTFSLSLGGEGSGLSQCTLALELESGLSFRTRHKLRKILPSVGLERTDIEVPLSAGEFILDRYYFRKQAGAMDVRKTLADIRMMRLALTCTEPHSLRLYSASLSFATANSSLAGPAMQPLEEIDYVERCSCPSNRIGANCESCADGYTTDPAFGGEFALCVRCFCNFHSSSCDPVSGVCTNCTGNTVGGDCERCREGYDRAQSLTILPCDRCADGYWNSSGVCIPCSCHLTGSLSPVCDRSSGVCDCMEGFAGERCDACSSSSSGTFPNCQPCDECTTQWEERILPLEEQVRTTVEFIGSLNLTNETTVGLAPELEALFELVAEIRAALNRSMIESLASEVNSTHSLTCSLLDRTESLLQRARQAEGGIQYLESVSNDITEQLELLQLRLSELDTEFRNISLIFAGEDFSSVDFDEFLQLARSALERSDLANSVIEENVTTLLNQTSDILSTYNQTLTASNFESTQTTISETLATIEERIQVFQAFIAESNSVLCGADNSTEVNCTLQCGGVACETCSGDSCDGLYSASITALNNSLTAVRLAEEVLARIQRQVDELRAFLEDVEVVQSSAFEAEGFANVTRAKAEGVLRDLQTLVGRIEEELSTERIDPAEIGRLENMTLSLQLELLPEEFLDLLIEINSTIEAFFSQANVSEEDLRRRVEEALQRALRADELARMIVINATALEDQLLALTRQQLEADAVANDTEQLVTRAEETIEETAQTLNGTEELVGSLGSLLSTLSSRLDSLQIQIDQNLRNLSIGRNLTATAVRVANQTEVESLSAEAEFDSLREAVQMKYEQSVEDLQAAQEIQNRTTVLQRLTQDQLLQVENLERIRQALIVEQEEIRADVARVANELETLDQNIRIHIARNTACLDTGILSRRRRRSLKSQSKS